METNFIFTHDLNVAAEQKTTWCPSSFYQMGYFAHDGMITYLEPDILEYEVKWVLESITTNKA